MIRLRNALLIGRHRDFRLAACGLAAILVAFLAYVARLSDVTHDAFHEMSLARLWLQTGVFPTSDVFAFTHTVSPTVHHEWGTGLILYWVAEASPLGLDGMAILRLILIVGLGALLYRVARNEGAHPLIFCMLAPVVFPVLWVGFANLRAQLFTLVFLAIELLLLQSDRRGGRRWVGTWSVLYVIWLNVHAGFVVGVALLAVHIVERWSGVLLWNRSGVWDPNGALHQDRWHAAWQRYWHHFVLIPITLLGVLCNPWGWDYVPYLIRAIGLPRTTMLEWQPLWMTHNPLVTLASFFASLLLVAYAARNRRWSRLNGWFFVCLAAYMCLKHLRHGSLYGVVWLALVPGWLTPTELGRSAIAWFQNRRSWAMIGLAAVLVGCGAFTVAHAPWRSTMPSGSPASLMSYPVGACDFLVECGWQGNMVTPFASGGYVSWRCHPRILVSLDGRYEVAYRGDVLPKHDRFFAGNPGWEQLLEEYEIDFLLVHQSDAVRDRLMEERFQRVWSIAYEDSGFVLLARREFLTRLEDRPNPEDRINLH